MNKKILAVGVTAVVAGAFWACGSGEIYQPSENDTLFKEMGSTKNLLCNEENQNCDGAFSSEAEVSSSSEDDDYVPPEIGDDDIGDIIINPGSSSSGDTLEIGGGITPAAGSLGTCAPKANPIQKGVTGAAQFSFTPNIGGNYKLVAFGNAKYDWNYGAGATASGASAGYDSAPVTYANSGSVVATVTVTMTDGVSQKIQCSPLQVNGDPITGCKCTTSATSADIADASTSTVSWTVSGCLSSSEITSYSWPTGFVGSGVSGSHTFTKKDETVTPVVVVGNNDNTKVNVECPSVFAIDGNNPDTVTPGSTSTVYKGARKYSFASCNNKTGEVTIQVASNVKDCAKLITSETTIASSVSYWNNADGNCTFESKAAFPMTVALAEGQTFQFTGGCY